MDLEFAEYYLASSPLGFGNIKFSGHYDRNGFFGYFTQKVDDNALPKYIPEKQVNVENRPED